MTIGAAVAAVMWMLNQSVLVWTESKAKAKPLTDQTVYVPTLTYGHELWGRMEWNGEPNQNLGRVEFRPGLNTVLNISGLVWFCLQGARLSLGRRRRSLVFWEETGWS